MSVVVCAPEMREVHRETVGVRWCFHCRERVEFVFVVLDTVEKPTYWDPIRAIRCSACNTTDGDCGFGRSREWE